jgi:hypothetical protein
MPVTDSSSDNSDTLPLEAVIVPVPPIAFPLIRTLPPDPAPPTTLEAI